MAKTYEKLGASASKAGLHKALKSSGVAADHRYFAKLIPGSADSSSFLHCDGAGTKSIAAYLLFRETGDPSYFRGLAQDALVMNLDDVFCLGVPENLSLANIINRNTALIPDEVLSELLSSFVELQSTFAGLGVEFDLAGGETADMGDLVRTLIVDAVLSGEIQNKSLLSPSDIKAGEVIVGLSSTGQVSYEDKPNSGIGSNGLTLARFALIKSDYLDRYPEINSKGAGEFDLDSRPPELGMTVGEALVSPTRSYAPVLKRIYSEANVSAAIHNTGGGQTKALRFSPGLRIIKDSLFPIPPLFKLIQDQAKVPPREMFEVFNMGHRFELYTEPGEAEKIIATAKEFSLEAKIIGRVEESERSELLIKTGSEELNYNLEE